MQPNVLPRPDLEQLNINYRRIPLLSIGKDVYCDTRLILRKLEALFPQGALGGSTGDQKVIERLLERWTGDAGVFVRAAQLIPLTFPAMKDDKFIKDREQLSGRPWKREALARARPEAMVQIRDAFEILETTILADGRDWIFNTEKPTLGDIEGKSRYM
jgi:glutathione S-transferase